MWQVFIGPGFPRMANDGRGGALSFVLVFCGNSTSRPLGSSFSSSAGEVGGRRLLCQLLLLLASKKAPRTTIKRAHARVRFPDACSFPRRPPPRGASVVVRLSSLSSAFWDLTISMYVYIHYAIGVYRTFKSGKRFVRGTFSQNFSFKQDHKVSEKNTASQAYGKTMPLQGTYFSQSMTRQVYSCRKDDIDISILTELRHIASRND